MPGEGGTQFVQAMLSGGGRSDIAAQLGGGGRAAAPAATPAPTDPKVEAAQASASGRNSTILTSPAGVTSAATLQKKELLGG